MKKLFVFLLLPMIAEAQPPIVSAGTMQTIQLPTSSVVLEGSAAGNGASISTQVWSLVVDPSNGGAQISCPTLLQTEVTGLSVWGNFVFKLVVTDSKGAKDSAYTRVNVLPACNPGPYKRYNITANGGGIYYPNTRNQPWRGGDTLVLPVGWIGGSVIFGGNSKVYGGNGNDANGLTGDPCHPLYIMGPDAGTDSSNKIRFDDHCQYISIIQNPRNPLTYAIRTYTVGGGLSNNFDFEWIHIDGANIHGQGATGILWKKHIDTTANGAIIPESIKDNYLMDNIHFANLQIDNADGEAMYIGSTAPQGGDGQGPNGFYPVRLRKITINNVRIFNAGWDGIQLSGATDSCSIHDDLVYNYGLVNMGSQQAGIIAGSVTNTMLYNDTIIKGTGNGLQVFGYGYEVVHDLYLDSCGRDGTSQGQATIFQKDIPDKVGPPQPGQKTLFYNVFIKHPQTFGAYRIQNDNGTGLVDTIRHDNFCIPNSTAGSYQKDYIITNPPAVIFSNGFTQNSSYIPPLIDAGPDQQVAGTSTTLIGTVTTFSPATACTGTGAGLWTQRSGPNVASIGSPTSLTTPVVGLIPGVYVFQLEGKDSNGLVAVSTVTVMVTGVRRRTPINTGAWQ